jgi:hypothetical protein
VIIFTSLTCSPHNDLYTISESTSIELKIRDGFLGQIFGVDKDNNGNIYFADRKLNKIWIFNETGELMKSIGRTGMGPGDLAEPVDVKFFNDTLLVLEAGNMRVSFFSLEGKFIKTFPVSQGQLTNMEFLSENRIIISESLGIRNYDIYTINGTRLTEHNTYRHGDKLLLPLQLPGGQMSAISNQEVLYSSITKYRILRINSEGDTLASYKNSPPGFYSPDLSNMNKLNKHKNWSLVGKPLRVKTLFIIQWVNRKVKNENVVWNYFIDIFNEKGQLIQEKIPTPQLFLYTDHQHLYSIRYNRSDSLNSNSILEVYQLNKTNSN